MISDFLQLSPELTEALHSKKPVVALESTIITHGMPFPKNVETAFKVEQAVRDNGAIPATTAILNGKMKAGLSIDEITQLGEIGCGVRKTSRRDFPLVITRRELGSTTVAGTLIISQLAGIKIMATGGIGGVHRGFAATLDVSADLPEIAKANVAIFSAGVKSILDIGMTLEYLETHGVPVLGFQTDKFPNFYTRNSGHNVDLRIDTPFEIAQLIQIKWNAGLNGGVLIACPIPHEQEPEIADIHFAIEEALVESCSKNIMGKGITPFLMAKIEELTRGKSLDANINLVINNARIASQTAAAFYNL